jgi:hypothetical protein
MKKYIILFLLFSTVGFAQNLNDYKYAMVPSKFSFLKDENMYNLNVLSKLFLQKYGFEAYLSTETAPEEFVTNNCNKIYVDLINSSTMFTTKLKVVFKDCKNNVLFASEEGLSRDKEYYVAYNEALRMAFDNFSVLKSHKYESNVKIAENVVDNSNVNIGETTSEIINSKLSVVTTENGFDLYNVESKLVLSAKKTSVKNVFIAIAGIERGVLQKGNDGVWYFEYYKVGSKKLISENLLFNL